MTLYYAAFWLPAAAQVLAPTWFTMVGVAGLLTLLVLLRRARADGVDRGSVATVVLSAYLAAVVGGVTIPALIALVERSLDGQPLRLRAVGMTSFWGYLAGTVAAVEVYDGDAPIGGLYGLTFGRFFHGESMYFRTSGASKLALWALSECLAARGFELIDCQVPTHHLASLGAEAWPRRRYLARLAANAAAPSLHTSWADWAAPAP